MRARPSSHRPLAALAAGLLLAAGLVLAPPAQAATSAVQWSGPYMSRPSCLDAQRLYSGSFTRVVYSCYAMTHTAWVFGYVTRTA